MKPKEMFIVLTKIEDRKKFVLKLRQLRREQDMRTLYTIL